MKNLKDYNELNLNESEDASPSTVSGLKEFLKNLPDDMELVGYDGSDREPIVSFYLDDPRSHSTPDEEKDYKGGFPKPVLIISVD